MGLRRKIQRDLMDSALPEDLKAEFHELSEWVSTLPGKYGDRVRVQLVDAASIEGFFKSLFRGARRYPAFSVKGHRYVGSDFSKVEALITRALS
jgi:hypothetical protein